MIVEARAGRWVVPPTRGVWLDAGLEHRVRMSGRVKMRTVFVEPDAVAHLPQGGCVVEVPPLLRELILAAALLPLSYEDTGRDGLLMRLLLAELAAIPRLPLYLPWPQDKRLRALCDALSRDLAQVHEAAYWAEQMQVSTRTLHRAFLRETGMTFGRWRQHARLLSALERLAHGEKILSIALDHGYTSQSAFSAMFKQHFGVPPSAFYT